MPTVNLNKSILEKLLGKKLPEEKLKERIAMLGTDLEKIEKNEIVVEVFPNRPDMLSEQGFARALSSFLGIHIGLKEYTVKKSGFKVIVDPNVTMRPYTVCAIVKNLTFNDQNIRSIMQIQEKLATTHGRNRKKSGYGIYPLSKINFPVHYIAKDPKEVSFHPLGMSNSINAIDIEKLHPKAKEYAHITKGWKKYPFFIDNKGNIMSMLPYTNSKETGLVDQTTKEVFIECSGTELKNVELALNILTTTLADMGGEIYSLEIVYKNKTMVTPNFTPEKMELDVQYVNKILGLSLDKSQGISLLKKMGFGYENNKVLVPSWRVDILHPIDLVEDIAIAYGYENFKEDIPNVATIGEEDPMEKFKNKLANYLIGHGLIETSSYYIANKEQQTTLMDIELPVVEIANPLNIEYNIGRYWLIPNLLEILKENKQYGYPQTIFEMGKVFTAQETTSLAITLAHQKVTFTEIKQILDALTQRLGLEYSLKETEHRSFIVGRSAVILINNKNVGILGEIHPKVLNNFSLETPVAALEINISELFNQIL